MPKKIVYLPKELREIKEFVDVSATRKPSHRSTKPPGGGITRRNKNHETFEEGYQYELRHSSEHDDLVRKTAEELKRMTASNPPAASSQVVDTPQEEVKPRSQLDDMFADILKNAGTQQEPKKQSRFSFGAEEDTSYNQSQQPIVHTQQSPVVMNHNVVIGKVMNYNPQAASAGPQIHHQPQVQVHTNAHVNNVMPPRQSHNHQSQSAPVVENHLKNNQYPPLNQQQQSPQSPKVVVGVHPNHIGSDVKVTVGRPKQSNNSGNTRVWTAEDLEAQFLQPEPQHAQPVPSAQPQVWDAAALEAELLGGAPASQSEQPQRQQNGGTRNQSRQNRNRRRQN